MTTIVTRAGKGSALTWTQADANFTNLNTAKYESGDSPTFNAATVTSLSVGGISLYPYNANNNKLFGLSGTPVQWQLDFGGIVSYGFKVSDNYFLVGRGSVSWVSHGMRLDSAGNYVYTSTGVTPVWAEFSGGQVQFMGANSGTAGNTITPNYPLQIDAGANIVNLQCGQLAFPATQNPSTNVNTLDDYEEGTWTPTLQFGGGSTGITYTTQVGRYVKVGKLVYCMLYFILSNKGSSTGAAVVSGLPFTTVNQSARGGGNQHYQANMSGLVSSVSLLPAQNGTTVSLYSLTTTGASSLTDTNFTNTGEIYAHFMYESAT